MTKKFFKQSNSLRFGKLLLLILFILIAFDVVSTVVALESHAGIEGSPLGANIVTGLVFKVLVPVSLVALCFIFRNDRVVSAVLLVGVVSLVAWYAIVAVNNAAILLGEEVVRSRRNRGPLIDEELVQKNNRGHYLTEKGVQYVRAKLVRHILGERD